MSYQWWQCEHAYGRHCADPDCRDYVCHKCKHLTRDHYCGEGPEIPHAGLCPTCGTGCTTAEHDAPVTWREAILSSGAYPEFDEFRQRVEESSLGAPNAKAARATVSDETAASIVQHAFGQLRGHPEVGK